ncbi:hypothetical protein AVEN_226360-1 [Araneus ventricosus]|uniref:Endonuclease/exonuclease/phosphatase domain-containing protein n=1 Tax=Araneus ventricosus TaxID=182803 RepID=A0A4Y2KWC6_ARAVE|nr:hypothetical protein AVEN_226360-1 [Araneus ventricosus]
MPSKQSSLFLWAFFQGNLGRSQKVTQELPHIFPGQVPNVYLLPEPYLFNAEAYGLPFKSACGCSKTWKVLFAVRNKEISMITRHIGNNLVAVELAVGADMFKIVSMYFPPSSNKNQLVRELEDALEKLRSHKVIIAGDANIRSSLWGPEL